MTIDFKAARAEITATRIARAELAAARAARDAQAAAARAARAARDAETVLDAYNRADGIAADARCAVAVAFDRLHRTDPGARADACAVTTAALDAAYRADRAEADANRALREAARTADRASATAVLARTMADSAAAHLHNLTNPEPTP
jgi:hypothetical protein